MMNIGNKILNNKIKLFTYGIMCSAFIIATQLFYLQINLQKIFLLRGKKNFLRTEKVQSPRGNILDCDGRLLATNRPIINLYWQGTGKSQLDKKQNALLEQLEIILDMSLRNDQRTMNFLKNTERRHTKYLLAPDISFEQFSQIEEQFPNHKNIAIATHFKRFYPYHNCASHILGYLGTLNFKSIGKMGLEKLFEEQLKGEEGLTIKTINSLGKDLAEQKVKETLAGQDIQITIDITLQQILENVFPKEYAGAFILMDPHDGALRALVSRPDFDPSIFLHPIMSSDWHTLQEKQPFLNRAFNAAYPPGSIFKLVTVSAALEHGIISVDTTWNCKGYTRLGKRKYWCNCHYGHGELTTMQAIAKSCNTLFYEIGKKITVNTLAHYAHLFGLGRRTGVIFNEKTGLVPTSEWKLQTKGERWWSGETLSVAIGQSFLLATPIQIACMIASIFTGYLVTPRTLKTEPIIKQQLTIKPETLTFLKKSMRWVVTKGTGKKISKVKDIEIYAKTSTAQISTIQKRQLGKAYLEHGWFVAHFNYKNYSPLVIVILVENAGSSSIALNIAKNFLIEYKKLKDMTI